MAERRYTSAGTDGWLNVRREPSGAIVALPEHIATEIESSSNGRDHFIVKEGVESGNRFSVKQGYLRKQAPAYRPAAIIQFILSRKTLIYPGVVSELLQTTKILLKQERTLFKSQISHTQ